MPAILAPLIMLIMIAFAAVLLRWRAVKGSLAPPGTSRALHLDGLRGLAAVSVFAHHCVTLQQAVSTGRWSAPQSTVVNVMGEGAVAVFFILSAYLFVGRTVAAGGKINIAEFASGRAFRILPLYGTAVAFCLLVVASASNFALVKGLGPTLHDLRGWLTFCFARCPDLNRVEMSWMMISPVWSLRYEWQLYLLIPLIGILLRVSTMFRYAIPFLFLSLSLYDFWFIYFAVGSTAVLMPLRAFSSSLLIAVIAGLLIAIPLTLGGATSWGGAFGIGLVFIAILYSKLASGFLSRPTFTFLGEISFSLYLLHLPIIFLIVFVVLPDSQVIEGNIALLVFGSLVSVVVLCAATLSYAKVELPFIQLGRSFGKAISSTSLSPIRPW